MSKMDGLRAMREANYAEMAKRTAAAAKSPGARPPRAAPPTAPTARAVKPAAPDETPPSAEPALCGHRNMSGRSCTREHGHAAKSHRYS